MAFLKNFPQVNISCIIKEMNILLRISVSECSVMMKIVIAQWLNSAIILKLVIK